MIVGLDDCDGDLIIYDFWIMFVLNIKAYY